MDVFGNLIKVTEPRPGSPPNTDDTDYTYNLRSQLTQVSMLRGGTTQIRTWNYDIQTGRLNSATQPETGTVHYTYNDDGTVATRRDPRNTRIEYSYDDYKRVTQMRYYNHSTGTQYVNARKDFVYDTDPMGGSYELGRLTEVVSYSELYGQSYREMFAYDQAGLVTKKRLRIDRNDSDPGGLDGRIRL